MKGVTEVRMLIPDVNEIIAFLLLDITVASLYRGSRTAAGDLSGIDLSTESSGLRRGSEAL